MTARDIRYYQQEAINEIIDELSNNSKCLVKMFCGSGKSLIMKNVVQHFNEKLSVFVFPSLSLIEQFYDDYLENSKDVLKVSSADDESTTDVKKIKKFLLKEITSKIICITYQSFHLLLNNLENNTIDICCFDEAHHAVGNTYQKLIFNDNNIISKQIFFTATPKNANGIVMYDKNDSSKSMCGKLIYDYSYYRGMTEGYLNPFDIEVGLFTENTNKSIYESIARSILTTGNNRVLTFHATVNSDADSSTKNFVDEKLFNKTFNSIVNAEFVSKKGFYKKICMIGLDATVSMKDRKKILTKFKKNKDNADDNDITILCSCETIGEGVDTNDANMCVFVDPKSSVVKIIQNIGRIVRKQYGIDKPKSTVLIPCWVDKSKYEHCKSVEERDAVVREDMSKDGNYSGILNVLSALQQEQEELFDACINYPDSYSRAEIETNFANQGYKIDDVVGDGGLVETIEHMIDKEVECDDIEDISKNENVCIEVYTDLIEDPVSKYNEDCDGEVVRLYKTENDDENQEDVYQPIIKKNGEKKGTKKEKVETIDKNKRPKIIFQCNSDVKVLWSIKEWDNSMESCMKSCLLECEVVDIWGERFESLKKFIDENNKTPSIHTDNINETILSNWFFTQNHNYRTGTKGMKNVIRCNIWKDFREEYKSLFVTKQDKWDANFNYLKEFIVNNDMKPSVDSKDENEKFIGNWFSKQNTDYNNKCRGMKDNIRYTTWGEFYDEFKHIIGNVEYRWESNLQQLKDFLVSNDRKPTEDSKDENEKFLAKWFSHQKSNYEGKKFNMKNETICKIWEEFINQFNQLFITIEDAWNTNFKKLKEFIIENGKKPSQTSVDEEEKTMANWVVTQNNRHNSKSRGMKRNARYDIWKDFKEEFKELFETVDTKWDNNFNKLKEFIATNDRKPTTDSNERSEKTMANWIVTQNHNCKNRTQGMKCDIRYNIWNNFKEEYRVLFVQDDNKWDTSFNSLKEFVINNCKKPSKDSENKCEKTMANWLNTQNTNFKTLKDGMQNDLRYKVWGEFYDEFKHINGNIEHTWESNFQLLKEFIVKNDRNPSEDSKDENEKHIGKWFSHQKTNYKKKSQGMTDESRFNKWTNFTSEYLTKKISKPIKQMNLKKFTKKTEEFVKETPENKKIRTKSQMEVLHQRYKTLSSTNLNKEFSENKNLWDEYHEMSEQNEESFPKESIPRNVIIDELEKQKTKRTKTIVDMGCGRAQISKHFTDKNDTRFKFINYDHVSSGETVISCDISNTPLENDSVEIVILSLAMWGSNCKSYIAEAHRILESNGLLYIIEATKRWSEEDENHNLIQGEEGGKLKKVLIENHFQVSESKIEKFSLFVCNKRQII